MQFGKVRVAQQLVNGDARSRDRKNVALRAPADRMLRILDLDLVRSAALGTYYRLSRGVFGASPDRRRNRRPADRWVKNHPRLRDDHLQTTKTGPSVQEQSRQGGNVLAMPASGSLATETACQRDVRLHPIADLGRTSQDVRNGPQPDSCTALVLRSSAYERRTLKLVGAADRPALAISPCSPA
jgi:hypothetical protein